jgi:hypothetical protein
MKSQRLDGTREKQGVNAALFGSLFSLNLIPGNEVKGQTAKRPVHTIPSELYALEKPESRENILQW